MSALAAPSTNNEKNGKHLDERQISTFPLEDLRIIDKLWRNYSGGKFGLSIQNEIYVQKAFELFDPKDPLKGWLNLVFSVGWNNQEYDDINFSLNAPEGHLPHLGKRFDGGKEFIGSFRWHYLSLLLTKLELENLKNGMIQKILEQNQNLKSEIDSLKQDIKTLLENQYELKTSQFKLQQEIDEIKNAKILSLEELNEFKANLINLEKNQIKIKLGTYHVRHIKGKERTVEEKDRYENWDMQPNETYKKLQKISYDENDNSFCFQEIPKILLALSMIDTEKSANLRVNCFIPDEKNKEYLNEHDFTIAVQADWDSYIYKVRVHWIAYGI